MPIKFKFNSAKKSSLSDFFKENEFVYDDTFVAGKTVAEMRLNYIKKLAKNVQATLIEGFEKSGGGDEKVQQLKEAFDKRVKTLDYDNLENMKESLSGTFLGLMIILGLSQKVHGENYWAEKRGWGEFDSWVKTMNKSIFELDEEVKKFFNNEAKA